MRTRHSDTLGGFRPCCQLSAAVRSRRVSGLHTSCRNALEGQTAPTCVRCVRGDLRGLCQSNVVSARSVSRLGGRRCPHVGLLTDDMTRPRCDDSFFAIGATCRFVVGGYPSCLSGSMLRSYSVGGCLIRGVACSGAVSRGIERSVLGDVPLTGNVVRTKRHVISQNRVVSGRACGILHSLGVMRRAGSKKTRQRNVVVKNRFILMFNVLFYF